MNKNLFCTYFDSNYLNRGLSLIESLDRANSGQYQLVVVCVDEIVRLALEKLQIPQVLTVPLHEVEFRDRKLLACKDNRTATEYMWTLTPSVILHLYERFPEYQHLTYVDADLYFWSSQDAILRELGSNQVLIHRHDFPERLEHLAIHGTYNVGLLCFQRSAQTKHILSWWRERCIEWCYKRLEDGKFGDQGYLDQWPQTFEGVKVNQHPGIGTAPWNHERYLFSSNHAGIPCVNGIEIVFFHFHGIRLISDGVILPCDQSIYDMTTNVYLTVYVPYLHSLARSEAKIRQVLNNRSYGYLSEAHDLKADESVIVRTDKADAFFSLPFPHQRILLDEQWTLALNPFVSNLSNQPQSENVV
ncbi:MAG: hypothetical protein KDD62_04000 [Bdellovibrionales bacterium]|nr:hypothetical protein [Bdellovibrionales bacterium]